MEKTRQIKILSIIALVLAISAMTLGFAAFSTTLNISSSASINPNSSDFAVKFSTSQDSLVVNAVTPSNISGNVTATNGVIENGASPTLTNLSATFTSPGQYVEYTVYARNEGAYTAYLNNVNFIGNKKCRGSSGTTDSLVQSACNSIGVTVTIGSNTYSTTSPVTGHPLDQNAGEEIKVRLEYASNGASADGAFEIKLPSVALVYSTVDDSSIQPTVPKVAKLVSGDLDTPGSIVSIGTESFYVIGKNGGNVKLFAMYNLHVGNNVASDYTVTPLSNPTGIQDSNTKSYGDSFPLVGTTAFSTGDSTSYEESFLKGYIDDYAWYLEMQGVNVFSARLITNNEITLLGCGEYQYCTSEHSWIYSTSYWANTFDEWCLWVMFDGMLTDDSPSRNNAFGVRPVIEIPISDVEI